MFLKCGYLSAREILRMIRTNRTTNYPALGKSADSGRGVERCGLPQYDGDRHRTVRPEDQGLFDICGFRRSGHEASVFEVVQFRSGESLVHRIDQRIARDEDHQGRGTEIEGFVADVLPDPYRAVFRHTETTVDYAQVDIDQLPGVVHRVGVDSGVCFGQDGGDGFGVGIVSADQLCKGVPVCRDDLPAGRDIQFCDLQSDAGSGPEDDDSIRGDNR